MTTREGLALVDAHRVAQARLRTATVAELVSLWPLLNPANVDDTFPGYHAAVRTLVNARRADSSALSAAYLRALRAAEGVPGTVAPALADRVKPDALETSLRVLGPVTIKRATGAGLTLEQASASALSQTAGAVVRHVANASRETIIGTVANDSAAGGWSRVTDGKACAFCAMLASRGPVYRSKSTADFEVHDRCGCEPVPFYGNDDGWTDQAKFYRQIYDESRVNGKTSLQNFRRTYEGRNPVG